MIDFDATEARIAAVKAVSLVVAIRRLAKPVGLDTNKLHDMEREFRAAAGDLQRVEKLLEEDRTRSLLSEPKGG